MRPPSCSITCVGSVQPENFSRMYAARPSGESFNPVPAHASISHAPFSPLTDSVGLRCLQMHVTRLLDQSDKVGQWIEFVGTATGEDQRGCEGAHDGLEETQGMVLRLHEEHVQMNSQDSVEAGEYHGEEKCPCLSG